MLALSEVIGLLGKRALPVLPPWGTGLAAVGAQRLGRRLSRRRWCCQLRYGRGLDNRRLKAAGFSYEHTTRETVQRFGEHLRLRIGAEGRAGALPVREGGRGLPALEPERARRGPAARPIPAGD